MAHKIGIYYDQAGFASIIKGPELASLEQDFMMQKLDEVKGAFLQEFGFEGAFRVQRVDTNSRRSRTTFRIAADDAKTGAVLKRNPGWLGRFLN